MNGSTGRSLDPLMYARWAAIKRRCNNPKDKIYKNYGGRGIKVCDEWNESFETFYSWAMETGYAEGLTLDRIDNNKGYCPENCRWITISEQNRNCRRNNMITHDGKTQCLTDWARELGIRPATIYDRINRGLSPEDALSVVKFERTAKVVKK